MSHRSIPSTFVKSVLQNGVGRHVCQLQRLTLTFCKSSGGSRGMRDFIENHLLQFTNENPGIVIYLKPRRHRPAYLTGEYLNGNVVNLHTNMMDQDTVCQWVEHLRTRSGMDIQRIRKYWHTDSPSIQGIWTPFTNRDTSINVREFPDEDLSKCIVLDKSATEKVKELADSLRLQRPNVVEMKEEV